jgi:hypothetical protein
MSKATYIQQFARTLSRRATTTTVRHSNAYALGKSLARCYNTNILPLAAKESADDSIKKFDKELEAITQEMSGHRALHHPYFDYLIAKAQTGVTAAQFDMHRANYFCRTRETIPSVARVVVAAAQNNDAQTLASAGKNLYEETGEGNHSLAHSLLLERSHNIHGAHIFGLPPLSLKESPHSTLLIPEVHEFVAKQTKLYTSPSYATVLGTGFAHEYAADAMLTQFYRSLFLPYKNHYNNGLFDAVAKYFLVHIGGVEERHAQDAKEALLRACKVGKDLDAVREGAFGFLDIQAKLWDGLLIAFEKAGKIGPIIHPIPQEDKSRSHVLTLAAARTNPPQRRE